MKKLFEFQMTRTYETYMEIEASSEEEAREILKNSMEEFYAKELEQCLVTEEKVKIECVHGSFHD